MLAKGHPQGGFFPAREWGFISWTELWVYGGGVQYSARLK